MSTNRLKRNTDKYELFWTGSRCNLSLFGSSGPSLQLGIDEIKPSDDVRLLGVTSAADLENVCKTYFLWLRQVRRISVTLWTIYQ